jgi:hypothetical protein
MSHVGVGVGGRMKSSSQSVIKFQSVKEAQDAYNGAQTSMAEAQKTGNATRASIHALQAKLKSSLEQLQDAATEIPPAAVWIPVRTSSQSSSHEEHVYSMLDVLEDVVSGHWPVNVKLRTMDSNECQQIKDLVSQRVWSLLTAALSVSEELNRLRKQEATHLCKAGVVASCLSSSCNNGCSCIPGSLHAWCC